MNATIARLRAEIASDLTAFAELVASTAALGLDAKSSQGDLAAAALALHHAYTAVEALLERISRTLEGTLPLGADWHQALLEGAVLEIQNVRPAVISRPTADLLRHLLGFRHFVRHGYRTKLEGGRLAELRTFAQRALPLLQQELAAFDGFLRRVGDSDG